MLPKTDHNGRAVIIMRPGLENSSDEQAKMRYLVYTLERAAALADAVAASDGKFVVVVDYFSGKVEMKNSPGFSVMKEVAAILQGHYPERLGGMLLCDAPGFFEGLYRLVRPFLHPVTREKIVFVRMRALERGDVAFVDWEGLPRVYGGDKEYEFDVDEYFGAV